MLLDVDRRVRPIFLYVPEAIYRRYDRPAWPKHAACQI